MVHDVLVVDDQKDIAVLIQDILKDEGYSVRIAQDSHEALTQIKRRPPQLVILDIWLNNSRFDGIQILDIIKKTFPEIVVVMISGHGNIETAISCVKKGAYDFIEKPFQIQRLLSIVAKGIETVKLQQELVDLKKRLPQERGFSGTSPAVQALRKNIAKMAKIQSRVFLKGAAGTGKKLAAKLLHEQSERGAFPFVHMNCATIDKDLFLGKFFGLEKNQDRPDHHVKIGLLEKAQGGTLYLENVHCLSPESQSVLTAFLKDQKFTRRGGTTPLSSDVRLIASVTRSEEEQSLLPDFLQRIKIEVLEIPALHQRQEDIPELALEFLEKFVQSPRTCTLSPEVEKTLRGHPWPQNVRQLRSAMEWAALMLGGQETVLQPHHLPQHIHAQEGQTAPPLLATNNLNLREAREEFERQYLLQQIQRFNGNIAKAAAAIGMERTALYRKVKSLKLMTGPMDAPV